MKRWIINIILGMFVLVIVTTAVICTVYKKITYLPDWYTDASTSISPTESMADSLLLDSNLKQSEDSKDYPDTILSNSESDERLPQDSAWSAPSSNSLSASAGAHNFDPAKRNEKLDKTVDLSQNESHIPIKKKAKNSQSIGSLQSIDELSFPAVMYDVIAREFGFDLSSAIRGSRSSISNDRIRLESIIDVSRIPWHQFPPSVTGNQIVTLLRNGTMGEISVRADIAPVIKGTTVLFAPSSTVSIGQLSYTLDEIADQLGIIPQVNLRHLGMSGVRLDQRRIWVEYE